MTLSLSFMLSAIVVKSSKTSFIVPPTVEPEPSTATRILRGLTSFEACSVDLVVKATEPVALPFCPA